MLIAVQIGHWSFLKREEEEDVRLMNIIKLTWLWKRMVRLLLRVPTWWCCEFSPKMVSWDIGVSGWRVDSVQASGTVLLAKAKDANLWENTDQTDNKQNNKPNKIRDSLVLSRSGAVFEARSLWDQLPSAKTSCTNSSQSIKAQWTSGVESESEFHDKIQQCLRILWFSVWCYSWVDALATWIGFQKSLRGSQDR